MAGFQEDSTFLSICRLLVQAEHGFEVGDIDWDYLARISSQHLVTCHIGHVLLSRYQHNLPKEVGQYFSGLLERNRERNQQALKEMLALINTFNEAGLDSCILKGMANIADELYPDPAVRIVTDTDVLIDKKRQPRYDECMKSLGYSQSNPGKYARDNPRAHHDAPWTRPDSEIRVELHTKVMPDPYQALLTVREAFSNRMEKNHAGTHVSLLTPTYRMIHLVAHAQLMNRFSLKDVFELRYLVDGFLARKAYEETIDWPMIVAKFRNNHYESELNDFVLALHRLLSAPIPKPCRIAPVNEWRWKKLNARFYSPLRWKIMHYAERAIRLPRRLSQPHWYREKWRFLMSTRAERENVLYGGSVKAHHRPRSKEDR